MKKTTLLVVAFILCLYSYAQEDPCAATAPPFLQDFESVTTPNLPDCSTLETLSGNDWVTANVTSNGFTTNVLKYKWNTSEDANTWYFTKGLTLEAGTSYRLQYGYGNNSFSYTEKLKVSIGTSATAADMSTQLADHPSIDFNQRKDTLINFTVPSTGTYYIGFNAYSEFNQFNLYVDDIQVDLSPSCIRPSDLNATAITSNSAELSWTENNSATSWDIYIKMDGDLEPDANTTPTVAGTTTNPTTLTGLTSGTVYSVYVRSICSSSDQSEWSTPFSFTTACAPIDEFTQNFDSTPTDSIPICWSTIINSTSDYAEIAVKNNSSAHSAPNQLRFYNSDDDAAETYLITPELTNIAAGTHQLHFYMNGDESTVAEIGTISDITDATSFTPIETLELSSDFQEYFVPFTASATGSHIAIKVTYTGTYSDAYLDDISWEPIPDCPKPLDLEVDQFTLTSATLSWAEQGSATTWDLYIVEAGSAAPDASTTPTDSGITSNPYTKSGLTANTSYDFYVRSACSDTEHSVWNGPINFFTGYCQGDAQGSTGSIDSFVTTGGFSNIDNSSTGGEQGYNDYTDMIVSQAASGTLDFTATTTSGTSGFAIFIDYNNDLDFDDEGETAYSSGSYTDEATGTISIPDTIAEGNYRLRVVSDYLSINPSPCQDGNSGEIEDYTLSVTPLPSCLAPTELTATVINLDSISLTWTENNSATSWNLIYGEQGFDPATEGTTVVVSDAPEYILTEFDLNTTYAFYVQSICSDTDESTLAGPYEFSTPYCTPNFTSNVEPITLVEVSNLSNTSDAAADDTNPAYEDFTDLTADMSVGGSYEVTVKGNSNGNYTNYITVFIDWNRNGTLNDEGEVFEIGSIENSTGTDDIQTTGTITVPTDIDLGTTRMRVYKNYNSSVTDPCANNSYGQVEDYTINITEAEAECPAPTGVFVDNITTNSADVTWLPGGPQLEWEVKYGLTGFDPATEGTSISASAPAVTITDLEAETTYDVYVRTLCSDADYSDWTAPESFTTEALAPCTPPTDLTVGETTDTTAEISWLPSGSETQWEVLYGPTGFDPTSAGTTITVANDPTTVLSELEASTSYDVYVRAICDTDYYSDWTGPTTFTTTLSVKDQLFNQFSFYPNPVQNQLTLKAETQIDKVVLYNLVGQVVLTSNPESLETQLNMSQLQSGVYLMKVYSNQSNKTFRVIKK